MNDRIDPELKALIAEGRRKGFVTHEEVHRMLPDELTSSEQALDKIAQQLDELDIELVEQATSFENAKGTDDEDEPPARPIRAEALEPKSSTLDPLTHSSPRPTVTSAS